MPFIGDASGFVEDGTSVLPKGASADAGWARLSDGTWVLGYLARMDVT
jgi:hypothetical protein